MVNDKFFRSVDGNALMAPHTTPTDYLMRIPRSHFFFFFFKVNKENRWMHLKAFTPQMPNAKCKHILAFKPKIPTPSELVKANYCKKKLQLCYSAILPLELHYS